MLQFVIFLPGMTSVIEFFYFLLIEKQERAQTFTIRSYEKIRIIEF